ncbi:DNA adenine methylase [Pedobacter nanyangensis]|uniref:DNA adenine methylase n=1 Tax=Pedobacter nanyangensis TaxID=1562389 RepID=UPI000DE282BF|nr:DNA adenine methylase [Pedobacter nanyangensis]
MNRKIRPIIKWTGGKFREFALFQEYIPAFERYIEPFFGGGGVFFALQPQTPAIINDKSQDLIRFYRQIKSRSFKTRLHQYADAWDEVTALSELIWESTGEKFCEFIQNKATLAVLTVSIETELRQALSTLEVLSDEDFLKNSADFYLHLKKSIESKASRLQKISLKSVGVFGPKEFKVHFETALKSGTYLFFRNLLNKNTKRKLLSEADAAANWYFVREFCYASMFRYNKKGVFNIPYGGILYNRKKFRKKANSIFVKPVQALFQHAEIHNQDFETLLSSLHLTPTDFIFIDPPYDSEFSEYDQNTFTQDDQKRLANFLINCAAKWMVVIKETPFIREVYNHPEVKIATFDKKYVYNMRGRNNRKATHLIITNY